MSVLQGRLQAALAPDYDVEHELGTGGMGVVFRARDRTLDRAVAIKIIRPDLATAQAAERFLREARTLASFSHPHIVPVHRAGEADGIPYYVMEYLEGETLADRLQRGPLTADQALRLADELLDALAAVHARGIVHRDVKPANIFLAEGRTVLSDFGIAKVTRADATGLTAPGNVIGTPGYMPPEQLAGGDVTERTDVAAAGMVIFEACTGTPWTYDSHSAHADWSRVPPEAQRALRRALSWSPAERWADAGEFRAALRGRTPAIRRRGLVMAAAGVALLLGAFALQRRSAGAAGTLLRVNVRPFTVDGAAGQPLGRMLAGDIVQALRAPADLELSLDSARGANLDVSGSVGRRGDSVSVALRVAGAGGNQTAAFDLAAAGLPAAVVDSLARALLLGIWRSRDTALGELPFDALPRTVVGMSAWAHAEALWAGAQWVAAEQAYRDAMRTDTSCALCGLRLMLVSRWLRRPPDTSLTRTVTASLRRFPPRYQQLVRAGLDTVDRWTALDAMVADNQRFDLAQFVYGDELFHRGALAGRPRREAMDHFQRAIDLRPRFAPARQHLAWVAIAEGERLTADSALRAYQDLGARDDPETMVVTALLDLGFAWRFLPPEQAVALTRGTVANPLIASFPDLPLGARYLEVFDAPAGVLWLGEHFERWREKPQLRTPGLVAQAVALTAMGRVDSARATLARLRGESMAPEYALSTGEFEAALVLFDSLDAAAALPRLDALLAPLTREGDATAAQRRRAAWMLSLAARRAGHADRARAWAAMVTGEPGRKPLATFLAAEALADAHRDSALRLTKPLLALDSAGAAGDPFFRALLHLRRAQWQADAGNTGAAVRSLLWHENYDLVGHFEGVMEAADADAAFGTLGRWHRGRLLVASGARGRQVCSALDGVRRLWADGEPAWRRRADEAGRTMQRLRCTA